MLERLLCLNADGDRGRRDVDIDEAEGGCGLLHRLRRGLGLALLNAHALPLLLDADVPVGLTDCARVDGYVLDEVLEDGASGGEVTRGAQSDLGDVPRHCRGAREEGSRQRFGENMTHRCGHSLLDSRHARRVDEGALTCTGGNGAAKRSRGCEMSKEARNKCASVVQRILCSSRCRPRMKGRYVNGSRRLTSPRREEVGLRALEGAQAV